MDNLNNIKFQINNLKSLIENDTYNKYWSEVTEESVLEMIEFLTGELQKLLNK